MGSDMIFKILLMPRNYRTKKPPCTYTDEDVPRAVTDVQNKTATLQQAQEKRRNMGKGRVSDESEEGEIDSVCLEMDQMPEVQYEKPDWSNILHGKFVLVSFIGGHRKKRHYKYDCCVQCVEEEQEISVTGYKCHNELATVFVVKENDECVKTVEFVSEKFDSLKSEILALKDEVKTVRSEITSLKSENSLLRSQVQDLQQYSRRDNIVINGIPETSNENVYDVLDNVADIIHAKDLNNSIRVAHRLPTRMKGKERPIVVRFAFRHSRDEWICCFKEEASYDASGPGISLKRLDPDLPQGRITAADHLAQHTLELLKKTRDVAFQREYNINKNFSEFCIMLQSFEIKFDIIILTEASLEHDTGYNLAGYNK
ncbi:hypothetical protein C0J52_18458 [Blattella germanica]|nr:hypothetical protein C0J52_18458 [Blattella germanica]